MTRLLAAIIAIAISAVFLTGCGLIGREQEHKIKAELEVPVTDPLVRQLTDVTSSIDIEASGEFAAGTYLCDKATIIILPGTRFQLKLSLPINNPALIYTRDATGSLWTSKPINVNAVQAPQTIKLASGEISGEVNMARSMGAFFLSLLQAANVTMDLRKMIQSTQIENATLVLRPGSNLLFDRKKIHIGAGSKIVLKDVTVDRNYNYNGNCLVDLKFLYGCKWIGDKAHCEFDGGSAHLHLSAGRTGNVLTLGLREKSREKQTIELQHCKFRFGKNHRSSSLSDASLINVDQLLWRYSGGASQADLHTRGVMDFRNTQLRLKTDIHETIAHFPGVVPATLQIDNDGTRRSVQFATTGSATADSGRIQIAKKATKLRLWLSNAVIGPVSFDRSGDLHFELENGIARLNQLDWHGTKSQFTLVTAGDSILSAPAGLLMDKSSQPNAKTNLKVPLSIKFGSATLNGGAGVLKLEDLNGKLMVDVGHDIRLYSDLEFSIPKLSLLSGRQADVKARGLELSVENGQTLLLMKSCTVQLPVKALEDAITSQLPDTFEFDLNKKLKEDKAWRYKNAVAKGVIIRNFKLGRVTPEPPDSLNFTATGDVEMTGVVDKSGLAALVKKAENCKWKTRPWKLSGHVEGAGKVQYRFLTDKGSSPKDLQFHLSMKVPIPDDVELDWSQVSGGPINVLERAVILSHLKKVAIPVDYLGRVELFGKNDVLSRSTKISRLVVKPEGNGSQIAFSAQTRL